MPEAPQPATDLRAATILFVYGTLKRGGSNHGWMQGQLYLGEARSAPGVTLYSLGQYPGLVVDASDRAGVTGELWAVDSIALARLDELEGVSEGLYAREPARLVEWPAGLAAAEAARAQLYRYLRPVDRRARLGAEWRVC